MGELFVFTLAVLTGTVTAGLSSSFYTLVTRRPASFSLLTEPLPGAATAILTLVLAGPIVIMRNAIAFRVSEGRPWVWFGLSVSIALFWSFIVGLFVLSVLLAR